MSTKNLYYARLRLNIATTVVQAIAIRASHNVIYENVTVQELKAHGFDVYYFNSKRQGELDFLVEHNGEFVEKNEIREDMFYKLNIDVLR